MPPFAPDLAESWGFTGRLEHLCPSAVLTSFPLFLDQRDETGHVPVLPHSSLSLAAPYCTGRGLSAVRRHLLSVPAVFAYVGHRYAGLSLLTGVFIFRA